ncbi:MAG: deoxyribodipyrimidine photo-lyase [Limnohabitans sp.]|jgi:deoxyribodipyrimidine photo-lyase|nr:deoxyribodipyrimidine photo-lyase [Limnohabitans sp.]
MARHVIWWIRRDMRLDDNPALSFSVHAESLLPVYIHADVEEAPWCMGGAQKWWLARRLRALDAQLTSVGSRLLVVQGEAAKVLADLVDTTGANEVVWNRRFEPAARAQESRVEGALDARQVKWHGFLGNHLFDPEEVATKDGNPYQVYTPFARNVRGRAVPAQPKSAPRAFPPPWNERSKRKPETTEAHRESLERSIAQLELEPRVPWDLGFRAQWQPSEDAANAHLARFLKAGIANYPVGRDDPSSVGTSLLSPSLAFGEIGIRRVWHHSARSGAPQESVDKFHAELLWREFATHVLFHFPKTDLLPLRPEYARFPWRNDAHALRAWQQGQTGYPLVDAGMRQLWHTGWMHNRVRMVVASFLVKHLLLPWQDGAKWFWDTLVDADLANNSLGWQWAAGSGADAAPYFRIFNPTSQAEKFDADASYIRRWVPELARLPASAAIAPWDAPPLVLAGAGVELGRSYPRPIVDHPMARERALQALTAVSKRGAVSRSQ